MSTIIDWTSLVNKVDPDRKKPRPVYKFGKRKFYNNVDRYGYGKFEIGVGVWRVGKDNVVAPSTGELLDWLRWEWQDHVNT